MRRLWWLLLIVAACGGDAASLPVPGTLTLRLHTPNANDGALVVVVSGGPVLAVRPAGSLELARNSDGAGTHLLLVGDLTEGVVALVDIPDISRASAYVATLEQVADRTSFSLLDAAAYQVTITPTP